MGSIASSASVPLGIPAGKSPCIQIQRGTEHIPGVIQPNIQTIRLDRLSDDRLIFRVGPVAVEIHNDFGFLRRVRSFGRREPGLPPRRPAGLPARGRSPPGSPGKRGSLRSARPPSRRPRRYRRVYPRHRRPHPRGCPCNPPGPPGRRGSPHPARPHCSARNRCKPACSPPQGVLPPTPEVRRIRASARPEILRKTAFCYASQHLLSIQKRGSPFLLETRPFLSNTSIYDRSIPEWSHCGLKSKKILEKTKI